MKIGLLSMPLAGHLHPMTALGRKMKARRHEVTFFGLPDARIVHDARGCLSWIIKRICGGQSRCSFARPFLNNRSEKIAVTGSIRLARVIPKRRSSRRWTIFLLRRQSATLQQPYLSFGDTKEEQNDRTTLQSWYRWIGAGQGLGGSRPCTSAACAVR
jgi:hypothetical protein